MVSRAILDLSKEVGRVVIPSYIHSFLTDHPNIQSFDKAYKDLTSSLPDGVPIPRLNEAILYYNIAKLQKVADRQLEAIRVSEDRINELMKEPETNKSDILWYQKNIEKKEKLYQEAIVTGKLL